MRKDSETMRLFEGRYPRECICAKTAGNHSYNFHFNFFTTPIDEFYTLMTPCNMLDGKMVPQPRYGKLYHCKYCGESWYLTENKERAVRLEKKDYTPFMKWLEFDFQIPDDWVRVFNEIGGEHAHYPCEVLYMPCEAILKDGRQVLATICFQKDPWIEEFGHPINRYVTEISEVHESPYMLSREIQELAMNANELAMGFRPTIIEAPSGEIFYIGGEFFFSNGKWKGKDMQVSACTMVKIATGEGYKYVITDPSGTKPEAKIFYDYRHLPPGDETENLAVFLGTWDDRLLVERTLHKTRW